MRARNVLGWLGLTALLLLPGISAARADEATRTDSVGRSGADRNSRLRANALASFEGRTIDLAGDWGEAKACLVWRQGGVLECFRTAQALDAREAQLAPRREALDAKVGGALEAYSYSCSSPLRLYDYYWYSGRRLSFWDRGLWQNLSDYGFEDQASSYVVGGCYVYLAEHADGGGWWFPGPTFPYAGVPVMSWGWQNTISSIYIA